ncbi:DEAD/DEAH box helicase [Streptomyces sp. WMMC1477]|uniref:DEAD/DEAH box helicase n=1 Tax=Streptomyces sp. WMMC1477 TaxID=3015155 RepID=UPI0022B60FB3|nr:DEAD/DEAH box helicase [Streptomyces sp. WMMC1477]MCZ7430153.1 Helicase associated domain protein [Streptomyces sp. WMMC1477]
MGGGAGSAGAFFLRPHQKEAVAAILAGLSDARGGDVRGQVVMATGTGKTVVAAAAAHRLVPYGRCGVLVPTLDLLTQTVEAWRRAGHRGRMIAVCSLGDDPLLEELGVRCTTDAGQLAGWAAQDGPVTVFATYASLVSQETRGDAENGAEGSSEGVHDGAGAGGAGGSGGRRGVLERALHGDGFTGPAMPGFDLLILDEAHRLSGDLGKSWAAALDNERVPAARRLFMTATPRLWEAPPAAGGGEARLVASMDDERLFGPVLHEQALMASVELGLLARWELHVLEITDPAPPGPEADPEEARGRRLAALQAALLAHLDDVGGRSLLTFHSTTLAAIAMARALPETAAQLHATEPARYPARVSAEWLSGEHPAPYRREVLARFADGLTRDGWVADAQILASCQVLAEGVDIRGQAGVDGVVLADPRNSPVQIVQILGRALRQEPGEGKVARIVVPVFLAPGEKPDQLMTSTAFAPVVATLQGLRAHDQRILERLTLATATSSGKPTNNIELDPLADTEKEKAAREQRERDRKREDLEHETGEPELGAKTEPEAGAGVPLLRFSRPRDPALIARFLRTRVIQPDNHVWLTGYDALTRWVQQHDDAHVPATAIITLHDGTPHRLGSWVQEQRRALTNGTLRPHRYQLLEELGMIWDTADAKFANGLTAARTYYQKFGTLCTPKDATVDSFPVGQFLENLRKKNGGTVLTETRDTALREIDPYWNPPWPVAWQRHYTALAYLLEGETTPPDIQPGVQVHGNDVGTWLRRQTTPAGWTQLTHGQQDLLVQVGIQAPATDTQHAARETPGIPDLHALDSFGRGLAACRQYLNREGHLSVPRQHEEVLHPAEPGDAPVVVRPGVFLSNQRSRRTKLSAERRRALADLGLEWAR